MTCARWPWAAGWRDYNGSRPGRLAEANRRLLRLQWQTLRPAAPILSLRGFVQDVTDRRGCNGRRPGQITETDLVAGDCKGRLRDQRQLSITLSHLHPLHHLRSLSAFDHFPSLRDDSLLFLMLCSSSLSIRPSTSTLFPASCGMTGGFLQALRAEEETAHASTLSLHLAALTTNTTSFLPLVDDPQGSLLNGGGCFALPSPSPDRLSLPTHSNQEDRSRRRWRWLAAGGDGGCCSWV